MTPDLSEARHIHLVGAGGAGMGAIANVLYRMGHTVTGSDLKDGPVVERLRVAGMEIHVGHDAANVGAADLVAISTAIPEHNPEVRSANERQIPLLRRSDILPAISAERRSIVVAGTHGKTTTSSMLAMAMVEADLDPSFIIGGDVNEIGSGAVWADGEWFIIEGDESDRTFLSLGAEIAIVTNVEPDHLETYDNDPEQLLAAFVQFADAATTPIYCADDAGAMQVASAVPGITYGTAEHADYRMVDIATGRASVAFTIRHDGAEVARVELPTPGMHNARNAAAAFVATIAAGGSAAAAAAALARFGGVARRFEFRGEIDGVTFVDDYAHLPTEVEAALAAAADGGWKTHTMRSHPPSAALWQDFADGFVGADVLVVTDIYASGETPRPGITGKLIVDAVLDAHPWSTVAWMPRLDDAAGWLAHRLRPGDLCLTLGAGDLTGLPDQVAGRLGHRGAA